MGLAGILLLLCGAFSVFSHAAEQTFPKGPEQMSPGWCDQQVPGCRQCTQQALPVSPGSNSHSLPPVLIVRCTACQEAYYVYSEANENCDCASGAATAYRNGTLLDDDDAVDGYSGDDETDSLSDTFEPGHFRPISPGTFHGYPPAIGLVSMSAGAAAAAATPAAAGAAAQTTLAGPGAAPAAAAATKVDVLKPQPFAPDATAIVAALLLQQQQRQQQRQQQKQHQQHQQQHHRGPMHPRHSLKPAGAGLGSRGSRGYVLPDNYMQVIAAAVSNNDASKPLPRRSVLERGDPSTPLTRRSRAGKLSPLRVTAAQRSADDDAGTSNDVVETASVEGQHSSSSSSSKHAGKGPKFYIITKNGIKLVKSTPDKDMQAKAHDKHDGRKDESEHTGKHGAGKDDLEHPGKHTSGWRYTHDHANSKHAPVRKHPAPLHTPRKHPVRSRRSHSKQISSNDKEQPDDNSKKSEHDGDSGDFETVEPEQLVCRPCPQGSVSKGGVIGAASCKLCPPGYTPDYQTQTCMHVTPPQAPVRSNPHPHQHSSYEDHQQQPDNQYRPDPQHIPVPHHGEHRHGMGDHDEHHTKRTVTAPIIHPLPKKHIASEQQQEQQQQQQTPSTGSKAQQQQPRVGSKAQTPSAEPSPVTFSQPANDTSSNSKDVARKTPEGATGSSPPSSSGSTTPAPAAAPAPIPTFTPTPNISNQPQAQAQAPQGATKGDGAAPKQPLEQRTTKKKQEQPFQGQMAQPLPEQQTTKGKKEQPSQEQNSQQPTTKATREQPSQGQAPKQLEQQPPTNTKKNKEPAQQEQMPKQLPEQPQQMMQEQPTTKTLRLKQAQEQQMPKQAQQPAKIVQIKQDYKTGEQPTKLPVGQRSVINVRQEHVPKQEQQQPKQRLPVKLQAGASYDLTESVEVQEAEVLGEDEEWEYIEEAVEVELMADEDVGDDDDDDDDGAKVEIMSGNTAVELGEEDDDDQDDDDDDTVAAEYAANVAAAVQSYAASRQRQGATGAVVLSTANNGQASSSVPAPTNTAKSPSSSAQSNKKVPAAKQEEEEDDEVDTEGYEEAEEEEEEEDVLNKIATVMVEGHMGDSTR